MHTDTVSESDVAIESDVTIESDADTVPRAEWPRWPRG